MKTFEQIHVESGTNATMTIGYSNIVGELRVMSKKIEQQVWSGHGGRSSTTVIPACSRWETTRWGFRASS
jgi:hypothetical protein